MEVVLYLLVSFLIGIAIAAGIIMLATRLVAGFTPKFLMAVVAAIASWIACIVVAFVLQMVLGPGMLLMLLLLVAYFVVNSAVLNALLKRADGSQMGFGKAALVTLLQIVIYFVLGIIFALVFGFGMFSMLMGGAAGAMH